jgi:hypothetical protein
MQTPNAIKTTGYLVSTLSVLLLVIVSWETAKFSPLLTACLAGGVMLSILGMVLRWLSYQIDKE